MMNNKKEEILKSISGLLNQTEESALEEIIFKSEDLKNFKSRFQENIDEMKNVYQDFPNQNYLDSLSDSVISKAENLYSTKLQPSFAYAFIVALVIFVASQLVNIENINSDGNYYELMNASDIDQYFSINESSELSYFSEIVDIELELDYTSYLFSNVQEYHLYNSSPENEIINSYNNAYQEEIYNEIINKKIL